VGVDEEGLEMLPEPDEQKDEAPGWKGWQIKLLVFLENYRLGVLGVRSLDVCVLVATIT
jgi:hypothetical protein